MASEEVEFVNELLRSMDFSAMSLDEQRAVLGGQAGAGPDGATVTAVDAGGVPCEWVTMAGQDQAATTVVSLRGGGYCLGSLASNRSLSARLSEATGGRVLNVGYRNAPEHPYPAALDDARRAYRWLLSTGTDPATVVFAGNSAGGGLVLACLLAERDGGGPMPAGAVAISPWTDLAATGASIVDNATTEVMLDPANVIESALLYANADQLTEPYVSPLYGDPTGLPPILLQVSGSEILRDDSLRFAARARAAGVDVTLEVVDGMPHVWHAFAGFLPEADAALAAIGDWVRAITAVSGVRDDRAVSI